MKSTGIKLIKQERQEQLEKHSIPVGQDVDFNSQEQLLEGAMYCLSGNQGVYPEKWQETTRYSIFKKSRVEQLAVAGALIAAEIDRLSHVEE